MLVKSQDRMFHFQERIFHACYSSDIVMLVSVKTMPSAMKMHVLVEGLNRTRSSIQLQYRVDQAPLYYFTVALVIHNEGHHS